MSTAPSSPWWEDHQVFAAETSRDDPAAALEQLSPGVLALLAEVEAAFAGRDEDTPGWADPHLLPDGTTRDSREEEYSRCVDPGKYRILHARAETWASVLTARGWAEATTLEDPAALDWVSAPLASVQRATVLRPHRPGAEPLVLARSGEASGAREKNGTGTKDGARDISDVDAVPGIVIGLGDPAVAVNESPDCGCDACDTGSRDLLEDLDVTILSIIDGSFAVTLAPDGIGMRTSFGASHGGGDEDPGSPADTITITAGPWADGWTPRELCPPIDPGAEAWAEEMLRESWTSRMFDRLLGVLPPPLAARLDGLRPGHSGTTRSVAYELREEDPVTAPRDALDHVPAGYRRSHRNTEIRDMSFEDAASALRCWVLQRRAGLRVLASNTPLEEGTEVHLRLGVGPLGVTAPCRVLRVIQEPERAGFAYGTLPGHPLSGIEAVTLTREEDGTSHLTIDAVWRPTTWYARLGGPFTRILQGRLTRRYLAALSSPPPPRSTSGDSTSGDST